MSKPANQEFITLFRQSAPYINKFRGKTFVIVFNGETVAAENFAHLIHDLALLDSLGIKLVLIHGARPQIEQKLQSIGIQFKYEQGIRITTDDALVCVKQAVACIRLEIEALLSMGLANSPMAGAKLRVTSGNFITAKPFGIRNGVDYQHTGEVRKIDTTGIKQQLDQGAIVLVSPLGYSPTGEIFNLLAEEVARETATALQADKLIYLTENDLIQEVTTPIPELTVSEAEELLESEQLKANKLSQETQQILKNAIDVCRAHVGRVHILDRHRDGALLQELFTRDGAGTLISSDLYEGTRAAVIDDIPGVLELIEPLEQQGILVRRSREKLEMEIQQFIVIERDRTIIACAAVFPFSENNSAELACFAVHPDYRNQGRGDTLLAYIENLLLQQKVTQLFVLSTHTAHWFLERGFIQSEISALPVEKKRLYNFQRNSKVFSKHLS